MKNLEKIPLLFTILSGLVAGATYLWNAESEAFLIAMLVGLGCIVAFCVTLLRWEKDHGAPFVGKLQIRFVHVGPTRVASVVCLMLALIAMSFVLVFLLQPAPLCDVYNSHWVIDDGKAENGSQRYALAWILDPKDPNQIMSDQGCGLSLDVWCKEKYPFVLVDEVRIVVESYKPINAPTLDPSFRGLQASSICIAEIDAVPEGESRRFVANYVVQKKDGALEVQSHEFQKVKVEKGKPESFFVKVTAKTPGVYRIYGEALISRESKQEVKRLGHTKEYLFHHLAPQ